MPRLKNRPPRMTRNRSTAVVYIDGEVVRLGKWGSTEAQEAYDRLIAEWWVSNIGGEAATQDVTRTIILYDKAGGTSSEEVPAFSWSGPDTLTLGPGDSDNFNTTNVPTDSGSWEAFEGYEFVLIIETECRTFTTRVPVVAPE